MDGNFIFEMENFIPNELCDDIIQRFENGPKKIQSTILDANKVVLDLERRNSVELMVKDMNNSCLLYTSPSPRDRTRSRMPSSA